MPLERDPQSEIEKLERRVAENPEGRMFAHLADAYRKAGEVEQAERLILEGLERHPNYLSAHLVLGRVYLDSERLDEAKRQFQKVLDLDPDNLIALKALGDLTVSEGSLPEARPWYERMLQVDPYNEEAQAALDELEAGTASGSTGSVGPGTEAVAAESERAEGEEIALPEPEALGTGASHGEPDSFETAESDPWADFAAELSAASQEAERAETTEEPPGEVETEAAEAPTAEAPESLPWDETIEPEAIEPEAIEAEAIEAEASGTESSAEQWAGQAEVEAGRSEASGADLDLDLAAMDDWSPGLVSDQFDGDELDEDQIDSGLTLGVGSVEDEAEEDVVTETMAELYARQGLEEEALKIYRQLAEVRPYDEAIRARIRELEERTGVSSGGGVDVGDMDLSGIEDEGDLAGIGESLEVEVDIDDAEPAPFEFEARAPDGAALAEVDPFAASFAGGQIAEEKAGESAPQGSVAEIETAPAEAGVADEGEEAIEVEMPGEEREVAGVAALEGEASAGGSTETEVAQTTESIQGYLQRLLRYTPGEHAPAGGNPAPANPGGSEGPDDRSGGAAKSESSRAGDEGEDLEQFQEWLRSLKR